MATLGKLDLGEPGTRLGGDGMRVGEKVPAGFSWTTHNGVQVTFNGNPVFDDGKNFYYRVNT